MCPAPAPAGPPKRVAVTHGVASQMGARKKDEDRTRVGACRVGERTFLYFGLYDGHGGKGAADLCAAELHDVAAKRAAEEAARSPEKRAAACLEAGLVAACWELDDRLGSLAVDSGTTATCLFVDADSSDGSCLLAWVGDSCAYRSGQDKRAKFQTSKAPISAVFHSFRLIFGRAIISRSALEA